MQGPGHYSALDSNANQNNNPNLCLSPHHQARPTTAFSQVPLAPPHPWDGGRGFPKRSFLPNSQQRVVRLKTSSPASPKKQTQPAYPESCQVSKYACALGLVELHFPASSALQRQGACAQRLIWLWRSPSLSVQVRNLLCSFVI